MNQQPASGPAQDTRDAAQQPDAKPNSEAGAAETPGRDEEVRLRKAYGDVKDALKNSRHT